MTKKLLLLAFVFTLLTTQDSFAQAGFPTLRVKEQDGSPDVFNVREVRFNNGTVTNPSPGVVSVNNAGGGGGSTNAFGTIDTPAGTDPLALTAPDTLILTESAGIDIVGTALTNTISFAYSASEAETANEAVLDLQDLQGTVTDAQVNGANESNEIDDDVMPFDDADSNFAATTIGPAIEELDDNNVSGPNATDYKVNWTQLGNMPTGFSDGTDADSNGFSSVTADTGVGAGADSNSDSLDLEGGTGITTSCITSPDSCIIALAVNELEGVTFGDGTGGEFFHAFDVDGSLDIKQTYGADGSIRWKAPASLSGDKPFAANEVGVGNNGFIFEGSTANAAELYLSVADPASDQSIILNINEATCTGDANGGALTMNASHQVICSTDDGGGGGGNSFTTIDAPTGIGDPVADSSTDTLTLTAGIGVSISGNSSTDTITISSDFSYENLYYGDGSGNEIYYGVDVDGVLDIRTTYGVDGSIRWMAPASLSGDKPFAADEVGVGLSGFIFEGSTANAFETYMSVTNPTADRTVTIPDANSTTVQPDTGSANNFLTAISASGVVSKAQPSFSNLSGGATDAQVPDNITIANTASRCARFDGSGNLTAASGDCTAGDTTGGGGAPTDAEYIVGEANAGLSAEVAPSAADQTPVSTTSTSVVFTALPDSDGATQKLQYDTTTHAYVAGTDDDVPESGDFGALSATAPITQSGGTISTSIATSRLVGRTTASTGPMEEITPDATLSLAAGGLGVVDVTCTGCLGTTEVAALDTGDVTTGNFVATVADGTGIDGTATGNASTFTPTLDLTEITCSAPLSCSAATTITTSVATSRIMGRTTAATGPIESLTAGAGLTLSAGNLGRAALTGDVTAGVDANVTTVANVPSGATVSIDETELQLGATDRLVGRDTAAAGPAEELTVGGGLEFTGSGGIQRSAFSGGDVTASAGSAVLTVANVPTGASVTITGADTITTPVIGSYLEMSEAAAPATPAAGVVRLYAKNSATAEFCSKDDAGTETCMSAGSGGSGDSVSVNGVAATDADFDDSTPSVPSGATNIKWQKDSGTPNNVSGYVEPWGLAFTSLALGVVSASPSTSQNDYSPTGWNGTQPSQAAVMLLTPTATIQITGVAGGASGRVLRIVNALDPSGSGARLILLPHESSSSTAANRLHNVGRVAQFLKPGDSIDYVYDATASRWRSVGAKKWQAFEVVEEFITSAWGIATVSGTAATCQQDSFRVGDSADSPLGVYSCDTGTTTSGRGSLSLPVSDAWVVPEQSQFLYLARVGGDTASTAGSDDFDSVTGLHDGRATTPFNATDGVYWLYDVDNSTAWRACSEDAGTQNCQSIGPTFSTTDYAWLGFYINGDWSNVDYFYSTDGVSWTIAGSESTDTNIPDAANTTNIVPILISRDAAGTTSQELQIDWMGYSYDDPH